MRRDPLPATKTPRSPKAAKGPKKPMPRKKAKPLKKPAEPKPRKKAKSAAAPKTSKKAALSAAARARKIAMPPKTLAPAAPSGAGKKSKSPAPFAPVAAPAPPPPPVSSAPPAPPAPSAAPAAQNETPDLDAPDLDAPDVEAQDGDAPAIDMQNADAPMASLTETTFHIRHDLQKRLDLYLKDRLAHHSRAAIQKVIKAGLAQVNGRTARASTLLRAGDTVRIKIPPPAEHKALPEPIPLAIVYEDEHFIAINKQAGLLVHPARGHWTGTMINALLHHAAQTAGTLSTGSDPWRPGIIHRLDRDTTGIILVAKTDEAHWRLAGQFERRTIKKTYLAIIHGQPVLDQDLIDAPIGLHKDNREKMAVRRDIGRPAQSVYTVIERFENFSLVELSPKTGRTHQLRVHMAFIGHPIVGDADYAGRTVTYADLGAKSPDPQALIMERQALHALRLQFVHPTHYKRMLLEAAMPEDMSNFLRLLRGLRR